MGGVRVLARIFLILGCLTLAGGVWFMLSYSTLVPHVDNSFIFSLLLATSLVLFLGWGVLTGLCEIHAQQKRLQEQLAGLKSGGDP